MHDIETMYLKFQAQLSRLQKHYKKKPHHHHHFVFKHYIICHRILQQYLNNQVAQTGKRQGFETSRIPTYIKAHTTQEAFRKQLLNLEELVLTTQSCSDGSGGIGPFVFPHTPCKTLPSTRFQAETRAAAGSLQPALI